jgi:hypothetical protein
LLKEIVGGTDKYYIQKENETRLKVHIFWKSSGIGLVVKDTYFGYKIIPEYGTV